MFSQKGKCSTIGYGRSGVRFPLGPSRPPASNFRKQLWEVVFGNNSRGELEQLWEADIRYSEQLWSAVLGNNFIEQFRGAALGNRSNFARQLRTEALKNNNFGK